VNPDTKKFLKLYFGLAIIVWLAVSIFLGPPGLSSEYSSQYKADHDRYLNITKSVPYKRWAQRPELNAPGMEGVPPTLEKDIAFVRDYTGRPEYQSETRRIFLYSLVMRFFTFILVIWIVWKLGKPPLLKLIDDKILELRGKIAAEENAREAAAQRKQAAQGKLERAKDEEHRIMTEAEERLDKEEAQLEYAHQQRLELMTRELEDRKHEEVHAAMMQVKAELVNHAIDELLKTYKEKADETLHAALIDGFTADLERHAS